MAGEFALMPMGGIAQKLIPLSHPLMLLGRARNCELVLDRASVSKVHCLFLNDGHSVLMRDLLSAAGTRVRGRAVHETILQPNDQVRFGAFGFRYIAPAPPPAKEDYFWLHLTDLHTGRRWRFSRRIVLIGSQEGCDVLLQRSDVAALHAVICRVDNGLILMRKLCHNLRLSRNGQPSNLTRVNNNDLVQAGPVSLSVVLMLRDGNIEPPDGNDLLEWSNAGVDDGMWTVVEDGPLTEDSRSAMPGLLSLERLSSRPTQSLDITDSVNETTDDDERDAAAPATPSVTPTASPSPANPGDSLTPP